MLQRKHRWTQWVIQTGYNETRSSGYLSSPYLVWAKSVSLSPIVINLFSFHYLFTICKGQACFIYCNIAASYNLPGAEVRLNKYSLINICRWVTNGNMELTFFAIPVLPEYKLITMNRNCLTQNPNLLIQGLQSLKSVPLHEFWELLRGLHVCSWAIPVSHHEVCCFLFSSLTHCSISVCHQRKYVMAFPLSPKLSAS